MRERFVDRMLGLMIQGIAKRKAKKEQKKLNPNNKLTMTDTTELVLGAATGFGASQVIPNDDVSVLVNALVSILTVVLTHFLRRRSEKK